MGGGLLTGRGPPSHRRDHNVIGEEDVDAAETVYGGILDALMERGDA